jgi:hypothetical protein
LTDGNGIDSLVDAGDTLPSVDVHEDGHRRRRLDARSGLLVSSDLSGLHAGTETYAEERGREAGIFDVTHEVSRCYDEYERLEYGREIRTHSSISLSDTATHPAEKTRDGCGKTETGRGLLDLGCGEEEDGALGRGLDPSLYPTREA